VEDSGESESGEWCLLGRLEDNGCPSSDGWGELVSDLIERVIERGDGEGATERFAKGKDLASLTLGRDIAGEHLAIVAQGFHGGETENVAGAADLVAGFAQAEAGFSGDDLGDGFAAFFEQGASAVEDLVALKAGERIARREGGYDGGLDVAAVGETDGADEAVIVRISDFELGL